MNHELGWVALGDSAAGPPPPKPLPPPRVLGLWNFSGSDTTVDRGGGCEMEMYETYYQESKVL